MAAGPIILLPTDFFPSSEYAFQMALSLARERGGRLVVLHVASPPPLVTPAGVVTEAGYEAYKQQLVRTLQSIQAPKRDVPITHRLEVGDPEETILRVAAEIHADLIVMGTHGKSWLERLVLGSVAQHILRKAPCPVLTVRAPVPESPPEPAPLP